MGVRVEAGGQKNITFVEEHGGHLTHLNPLHDVEMIYVTSRSLCGNKEAVRSKYHAQRQGYFKEQPDDLLWFLWNITSTIL